MKAVTLQAFFPEVKGVQYFTGRGEASNWKAATSRALKDVTRQLNGKHVKTAKFTISVTTKKNPGADPCIHCQRDMSKMSEATKAAHVAGECKVNGCSGLGELKPQR